MAHVAGPGLASGKIKRLAIHLMLLAATFILQMTGMPAQAQAAADEAAVARRVKAAYLYRFTTYVHWPSAVFADSDSPLVIGVLGSDLLAEDLTALVAGKSFEGRRFEVRKLRRSDSLADLHMLFVPSGYVAPLAMVLAGLPPRGTLVITDSPGALAQGSAINFLQVNEQVRFELSLEAAEKSGLKLSSRLVNVAHNFAGKTR